MYEETFWCTCVNDLYQTVKEKEGKKTRLCSIICNCDILNDQCCTRVEIVRTKEKH